MSRWGGRWGGRWGDRWGVTVLSEAFLRAIFARPTPNDLTVNIDIADIVVNLPVNDITVRTGTTDLTVNQT